jgi:hypothetical protein
MPDRVLHCYLPQPLRRNAAAGEVNIITRIGAALEPSGWRVIYHADDAAERDKSLKRKGYGLFHMQEPLTDRTLNLRRAFHVPFWQIEETNERWNFDVAQVGFDPAEVDRGDADSFAARWRKALLEPGTVRRDGFILMPLQGKLLIQRSFQSMSPVAMIEATLAADPGRRIVATLHPKESYSAEERAALAAIAARHPRFTVGPGSDRLILTCDYVVTQNSGVAMKGFFAGKPAVQFARSEFHHIAASVPRDGVAAAFAQVRGPLPDFAGYVTWFFRQHCINGGAPDVEAQILARFRRHGWPV